MRKVLRLIAVKRSDSKVRVPVDAVLEEKAMRCPPALKWLSFMLNPKFEALRQLADPAVVSELEKLVETGQDWELCRIWTSTSDSRFRA